LKDATAINKNDMSCRGLKGEAKKKCMNKYKKESKRHFPSFNQAKDTVVSATSRSYSAATGISRMKALSANPKSNPSSSTKEFSVGNKYTSLRKIKKQ